MKREIIKIENGVVSVQKSGNIRMTQHEIATLFGVYVQTVNAAIKVILKSGIIRSDTSCPAMVSGNTVLPDVYGLEMVTALAFRIHSKNAQVLREWILWKISKLEWMLVISAQNPVLN